MGYLDKLAKISARKRYEAEFDFGQGDGPEKLIFQALNYNERKKIFTSRTKVLGKDKDGNDIRGIDTSAEALDLNAEVLACSWIKEDGKQVADKSALMLWDCDLVDKLATLCLKTTGLAKEEPKEGEGEKTENPSTPQSESGTP